MSLTRVEQERLIEQARRGSPEERNAAHRALLADFRPFALAVVHRSLAAAGVGHEHAEEAWLQATFRFFTAGLQQFSGEAAPRSYFLRIALHAAIDVIRAVQQRPLPVEAVAADPFAARLEAGEQRRQLEALRACVAALPHEGAQAVRLYYLEEAGSCAVCAARLGIGTLAFMKRLERARRRLERCVRARLAAPGCEDHSEGLSNRGSWRGGGMGGD